MKPSELKRLMAALEALSAEECVKVQQVLQGRERSLHSNVAIAEAEAAVDRCPHCGSRDIAKAGSKGGRRRFKCKAAGCGKSFNALTGTPLAGLRKAEKHLDNAKCMVRGLTVRDTAALLGVNAKTAFRWRHRFLESLRAIQPESLSGVVEADETFFRESFKGQRTGLPRPAKKRGTPARKRGLSKEQIPVIVARDRSSGATLSAKLASRNAKDIGDALLPRLAKDALLCTDGASAYRTIGKNNGIAVKSVPAKKSSGAFHINGVNAFDSRLKGWMFRFNGVATKYLDNYLGWHRFLDRKGTATPAKRFLEPSFKRKA